MDPIYFWSYYGLGLIQEQHGHAREAIKLYQQTLSLNPEFSLAQDAIRRLEHIDLQKSLNEQ